MSQNTEYLKIYLNVQSELVWIKEWSWFNPSCVCEPGQRKILLFFPSEWWLNRLPVTPFIHSHVLFCLHPDVRSVQVSVLAVNLSADTVLAPPSGQNWKASSIWKRGELLSCGRTLANQRILAFSCHQSGSWVFVLLPTTDHPVSRCQEHRLGVIWWQEETRDPIWRLVNILHGPTAFLSVRSRFIVFPLYSFVDSIKITTSCFPVPSICCHDLVYDWFESLGECLHWNVRKRQARLADASDSSDTENWSRPRPHQNADPGSELAAARPRRSSHSEDDEWQELWAARARSTPQYWAVCSFYLVTPS